jgi:hypothetical protein
MESLMPASPLRFIPDETAKGGSLIGNSYISTFANCWLKGFNTYIRPCEGQRGIRARFRSEHLIKGGIFHEAIAELYLSGCRDGEDTGIWDLEQALGKLDEECLKATDEYPDSQKLEDDKLMMRNMLTNYYAKYGPGGPAQDFPIVVKVLHDEAGEPLIEREFRVDLGYKDYAFTMRADLLVEHHGRPVIMEHKTSAAGFWPQQRLNSIHTDAQFTGQCFVLATLFPGQILDGVLCNVVIKKGKTEIALRDLTNRDYLDFNVFRLSVLDILQQIDHRMEGFSNDLDSGWEMEEAVTRWFPDHGQRTGACTAFGTGCEYQLLCRNKTRIKQGLETYHPRNTEDLLRMKGSPV